NELGRTAFLPPDPEPAPTGRGIVLICTAGTSDLAVAEEAAVSARALKNRVERLTDVGVAGIHRLLTQTDVLRSASVIIVVAGRGSLWAVLAAAGGAALAVGWTIRWRAGRLRRRGPPPLGLGEVLDLLRQAYSATAGWGVGGAEGPLETGTQEMDPDRRRRGAALVQLASVDGRLHVVRDPEATFVAVGDFPYAAGLALPGARHATTVIDEIAGALRRFVAGMRVA